MEKMIEWGIESVKFAPLAQSGAFPDFSAAETVTADMIEMDTFTHEEAENGTTEIQWEDMDVTLTLPGSPGKKSITFTSNNTSMEVLKFFKMYKEGTGTNSGYIVNDPKSNDSQTLAMQYVTRAIDNYPALRYEFTPVLVTVKKSGNTSKNGLPGLTFTCVFQPNFDSNGNAIENMRMQEITSSEG